MRVYHLWEVNVYYSPPMWVPRAVQSVASSNLTASHCKFILTATIVTCSTYVQDVIRYANVHSYKITLYCLYRPMSENQEWVSADQLSAVLDYHPIAARRYTIGHSRPGHPYV
jgi:hypothetical protein